MMAGIPLALGSYWGLLIVIAGADSVGGPHHRRGEDARHELAGYPDYMQKVRYRLVPLLW